MELFDGMTILVSRYASKDTAYLVSKTKDREGNDSWSFAKIEDIGTPRGHDDFKFIAIDEARGV